MNAEGDFLTSNAVKSMNGAYVEYWSYINGWVVRAAQKLGYTAISQKASDYLMQYYLGENAGFLTHKVTEQSGITDVLTTAQLGLVNLEMKNINIAVAAGNYLCKTITKQPNLAQGFYLRLNKSGQFVTQFTQEQTLFNFISRTAPNQLYFMIGYLAAYLAILYMETKNDKFLKKCIEYLDFALSCNETILQCDFSHKIAWAASLAYKCTGDKKYLPVIEEISNYYIAKKKEGRWYNDDIIASYDQSAEIACWFLNIVKNLNS